MTERRRWETPQLPVPKRPYRDSVVFYAVLAVIVVVVAWLTGGAVLPGNIGDGEIGALIVAVVFFVVATGWSWWRFRSRLAREARHRAGRARR